MNPKLTPTEFIAATNQALEYSFSDTLIEGEVASFKINQGKWVFFDLKDEESSISCFMPVWDLRIPLEDGMKIVIRGLPKLTKWGKFSVTVLKLQPVGEGSLKKAYEILKKKLAGEGLFDPAKKRPLPENISKLGVISSTQAAGYADFIKIINARWGGIKVQVAHTQVQGMDAPDQIIRALNYFNERSDVEAIAILRGGGSADDLSAFNDEALVRAIAASRIPIITGIGHEIDESLSDLAADVRASTPSNAAEIITKDKKAEISNINIQMRSVASRISEIINHERMNNATKIKQISTSLVSKYIQPTITANSEKLSSAFQAIDHEYQKIKEKIAQAIRLLEVLNPEKVLKQGYVILSGKISPGELIKITTINNNINAEIKEIYERKT